MVVSFEQRHAFIVFSLKKQLLLVLSLDVCCRGRFVVFSWAKDNPICFLFSTLGVCLGFDYSTIILLLGRFV